LLKPTGGTVRLFGTLSRPGAAVEHHRIGYLPGEFKLWRSLSARRSLSVLAALGPIDPGTAEHRQELAERLGLDLRRPLRTLSKGNRQKAGVVSAFQHKPQLLVLDEPSSGLDPLVRQVVLDLIRESMTAGAAVLLSSHDLSEVAAVAHHVGILRSGRLVEVAPLAQVIQKEARHLKVWFRSSEGPVVSLHDLPSDTRVVRQESDHLHLAYTGSVDGLLKWLARFKVERIATPETSLEDAFLQHYRNASVDRAAQDARRSAPIRPERSE